jgi:hypothetical protein
MSVSFKQYTQAKHWLAVFTEVAERLEREGPAVGEHPMLHRAEIAGCRAQIADLSGQIAEYEAKHTDATTKGPTATES